MSHPSALRLAAETLATVLRPPPVARLSDWMADNIVLVDGPLAGQMWSPDGAPYLVEIADCLSDDHPSNLVTVRKSQQTGASILALAWCLFIADREPANTLYGVPGIDALRDLNSGKLQPLIDAFQRKAGRTVIVPQTSRSGDGSKTFEKVFWRGGRLWLANANSVMDLSSKTAKKGVKDEVSKWQDIPGAGDPEILYFGRFTAFRRLKDYKILEISTPEVDTGDDLGEAPGHCRIDRSFRRSDQRFWHAPCPECANLFVHDVKQFRVDRAHPHRSTYMCENCGHDISEAERVIHIMPAAGARWIAKSPGPDRHPGFHIDAFISKMMSYEAIAEDLIRSERGGETARKDFSTLVLGLPYAFRGDAPDWQRLFDRRAPHWKRGYVPPSGLLLTAAIDVQMRGVWYEVVAWAPDRQSWTVDRDYIDGETDSPTAPVFQKVREAILDRRFADAFGRERLIDAIAIDSGYRANVVYAFVRNAQQPHPDTGRDRLLAIKGDEGWAKPPLGTPTLVDIDLDGRKVKQGCKLWKVGTWPLKSSVYLDLGKQRSDAEEFPSGYCHFGEWLDEVYFRQLTAAHLEEVTVRGRAAGRRWVDGRENHLLDCRVYNLALAEYLGLSSTTPAEWAALARRRGLPDELLKTDIFTPTQSEPSQTVAQPEAAEPPPQRSTWIPRRPGGWLRR